MKKTEARFTDHMEARVSGANAKQEGVVMFLRPDVEVHTDPTRVIGRRTTCDSDEHPYLRGYEVVVVAVLKNALQTEECEYLTTEDAVHAAGGVGPDDRVEVAPILPKEGLSFVTSDPRAIDLEAFRFLAHGRAN
jgi:hypothetical protein